MSHWQQITTTQWSLFDDRGDRIHHIIRRGPTIGFPEVRFEVDGSGEGRSFATLAEAKDAAEAMP